jgi:hypothetical protein
LAGRHIIHWTDSKNVEKVMMKGSKTDSLQWLALDLYKHARRLGANLKVVWRPRADPRLQLADDWSRAVDSQDWGLSPRDFQYVKSTSQELQFDLFATDANHRLPRFASILASDLAEFRDAFTQNWAGLGYCYVQPPIESVGAVIRKICKDKSRGVLIVPHWRSMKDWLLISSDGVHANNMFDRVEKFWPVYQKGLDSLSSTFHGQPKFATLILGYDGSRAWPSRSNVTKLACLETDCRYCL